MDADKWSGSTGARWPCYLPNCGISVSSYVGEAPVATSGTCWLQSTDTTCVVCRPSFVDIPATPSSSSSSHTRLYQPAADAAEDTSKQTNDTG